MFGYLWYLSFFFLFLFLSHCNTRGGCFREVRHGKMRRSTGLLLVLAMGALYAVLSSRIEGWQASPYRSQHNVSPPLAHDEVSQKAICDHLRQTFRHSSQANGTASLLPAVYRGEHLLPDNCRLVLRLPMPWKSFGLCNVRALLLDFIVLAALVGADVLLPEVPSLSTASSSVLQLDSFFNVEQLSERWSSFCPSMKFFRSPSSNLTDQQSQLLTTLDPARTLYQNSLEKVRVGSTREDLSVENNVEKRLKELDHGIRQWLLRSRRSIRLQQPTAVVVNIKKWSLWDWAVPLDDSGARMRRDIGASLASAEYIATVARRIITHLRRASTERGGAGTFCGAHLRSEPDMRHMGIFASGRELGRLFLDAAVAAGTCSLLYVAAGTLEDLNWLAEVALPRGIEVLTRRTLLSSFPSSAHETAGWTYAQTAVLEYEILAASSRMFGASVSSFSWNLAIRRHLLSRQGAADNGAMAQLCAPRKESLGDVIHPSDSVSFDDGCTTLFMGLREHATQAHLEQRGQRGMWP